MDDSSVYIPDLKARVVECEWKFEINMLKKSEHVETHDNEIYLTLQKHNLIGLLESAAISNDWLCKFILFIYPCPHASFNPNGEWFLWRQFLKPYSNANALCYVICIFYAYWCLAWFPKKLIFMSFHRNTTCVTSGAGTAYPSGSHEIIPFLVRLVLLDP